MPTEVKKYLKAQGKKSIDVIVAIRDNLDSPTAVRLEAARYVFDQLYGRAGQRVDLAGDIVSQIEVVIRKEYGNSTGNQAPT